MIIAFVRSLAFLLSLNDLSPSMPTSDSESKFNESRDVFTILIMQLNTPYSMWCTRVIHDPSMRIPPLSDRTQTPSYKKSTKKNVNSWTQLNRGEQSGCRGLPSEYRLVIRAGGDLHHIRLGWKAVSDGQGTLQTEELHRLGWHYTVITKDNRQLHRPKKRNLPLRSCHLS